MTSRGLRTVPVRRLLALVLALGIAVLLAVPRVARAQETQHVLVLHSYNQGLTWTDSEDAAIRSRLRTRVAEVEVHTEYLDAKRYTGEEHFARVADLMERKYESLRFSAIIATDDNAYDFLVERRDELFPDTPVVFCGVNYFSGKAPPGFTGVVESFDIPATLDVALKLHPSASRVVVINDRTATGLANKRIVTEQVIPRFSDRVDFVFYEDFTMEELLGKVSEITPDDIILLLTLNQDSAGEVFSYDQSIALISRQARAPMYGVWDFYLGKGIVGGGLVTGYDQGRTAGDMALRVLDGTPVSEIPVVRSTPIRYEFDYRQMQRFDIQKRELPQGSRVINEPQSFYSLHREFVWGVALGFLALVTIIALLLLNIRQRKLGEAALSTSEEKYRSLVNHINIAVARSTPAGRFIQVNPAMADIFGYDSPEQLMSAPVPAIYRAPGDRERVYEELVRSGEVKNIELPMNTRDGREIIVSLSSTAQYDEQGAIEWVDSVLEDITERKHAEERLREKDLAIRQAYTDVIDAATGGKLVLMTEDEIFAALGEPVLPPRPLDEKRNLAEDRHALSTALESLAPAPRDLSGYILASSEAMTNALKHGGTGEFEVRRTKSCAQVVVKDFGPGIEFRSLPKATLVPGFSTKQTLGMGFTIMLGVADRVLLTTRPELTMVVLEMVLGAGDDPEQ